MLNSRTLFFYSSLLILFSLNSSAQTSSSSPYSRYGIGDLQFAGFTKNIGMGGISFGQTPLYNLNLSNPASYSSLALTTFETAVNVNLVQLKTSSKVQKISSAYLSYFAFGFPVKSKKWGTCFGLLPYSNVGYSINETFTNAAGDAELHTYQGSGGLNQFFIGNGYSPFRNFSIGANASYLFGVINQERRIEYPIIANYMNTRITQTVSVGSVYFNFGMQLTFDSLKLGPSDSLKMYDRMSEHVYQSVNLIKDSICNALNSTLLNSKRNLQAEKEKAISLRDQVIKNIHKISHSPADSIVILNKKLSDLKDSISLAEDSMSLAGAANEMKWEILRKNLKSEYKTTKESRKQIVRVKAVPAADLQEQVTRLDKKIISIDSSLNVLNDSLSRFTEKLKVILESAEENSKPELQRINSLRNKVVHRRDKNDWSLTLGLVGSPRTSLSATGNSLTESFLYDTFDEIRVRDTIENLSGEKGKLVLPLSAGFGVMLKQGSRWLIGSDFSLQNWKDYSIFGATDALTNSWRVSAGTQFTPNERAIKSYWKNVQYRMGFHYGKTYLELRDHQLTEYAVSVGLGLPVKRSAAMLHLSAEAGRRGTILNNLIEENFIKISIGFTLNDRWFIKPKFD